MFDRHLYHDTLDTLILTFPIRLTRWFGSNLINMDEIDPLEDGCGGQRLLEMTSTTLEYVPNTVSEALMDQNTIFPFCDTLTHNRAADLLHSADLC